MARSLSGIALVTGGASGLGRATCIALGAAGVQSVVADLDVDGAKETVAQVTAGGGTAIAERFDVASAQDRRDLVGELFGRHGAQFSMLVNVAGIDRPGYLTDLDVEDYQQVFAVNCHGPTLLIKEFVTGYLRARASAAPDVEFADVVNVLSISAVTVGSGAVAYNSSKAAFAKATEIFQTEVREQGLPCRIQGLMPAAMDTPMMAQWSIPADRMMPPGAVADEIVHALRRPRGVVGQNLVVVPSTEHFPR